MVGRRALIVVALRAVVQSPTLTSSAVGRMKNASCSALVVVVAAVAVPAAAALWQLLGRFEEVIWVSI